MNKLLESIVAKTKETPQVVERSEHWLPTGSTVADLVVGAGRGMGFEAGQVINLCALSGGGKTAFVNEIIGNGFKEYGEDFRWVYDPTTENGNTFDTKKLYGIDIVDEKRKSSETIEEAFNNIMIFIDSLKPGQRGVYALDSIDAVTSKEVDDSVDERIKAHKAEKEYDKGSYGMGKMKFLSNTMMPTITAAAEKKNCLIIIVSQLRDNVNAGLYAPKDKVSNGRALFYYCSAQVWIKSKRDIEKGGLQIGSVMHITTKKARGPNPYREGMFTFYYTYGIDDIGSNIDFLYDLLTPERGEMKKTEAKAIAWGEELFTRLELIDHIENEDLEQELRNRVIEKWNNREIEAVSEIAGRKARF
jgi:RecA/RadA recombinase